MQQSLLLSVIYYYLLIIPRCHFLFIHEFRMLGQDTTLHEFYQFQDGPEPDGLVAFHPGDASLPGSCLSLLNFYNE